MRSQSVLLQGVLFTFSIVLAFWVFAAPARAQDPFEIRVEQYERPHWGQLSFEMHFNHVARGTTVADGTVFATQHQFHASPELTVGLTNHLSAGIMVMSAVVPGHGGLEYIGWRFKAHLFAPDSLHLPVRLGLTTEIALQRTLIDEHRRVLELRPVIERNFGRAQLDLNLSFEKALGKNIASAGWEFEPSFRVSFLASPRFSPSIEYFGSTGALIHPSPWHEQVHQLYPGLTVRLAKNIDWEFGVGFGLTPAGSRLVYKTRIEVPFGITAKN